MPPLFGKPDELLEWISLCLPAVGGKPSFCCWCCWCRRLPDGFRPCSVLHHASARPGGGNPPTAIPLRAHLASWPTWVVVWTAFLLGSPSSTAVSSCQQQATFVGGAPSSTRTGRGQDQRHCGSAAVAAACSRRPQRHPPARLTNESTATCRKWRAKTQAHRQDMCVCFHTHRFGNASWGLFDLEMPGRQSTGCSVPPLQVGPVAGEELEVVNWEESLAPAQTKRGDLAISCQWWGRMWLSELYPASVRLACVQMLANGQAGSAIKSRMVPILRLSVVQGKTGWL